MKHRIPIKDESPKSCFTCTHGYLGVNGVLCEFTKSFVFDESTALECEAYDDGMERPR